MGKKGTFSAFFAYKTMAAGKIYIGTSGYSYKGWHDRFYPEGLKQADLLGFFSSHFNAVEINNSFYHLPDPKAVKNWAAQTPRDFKFCLKISRYITHNKKLLDSAEHAPKFLRAVKNAAAKKGPLLLQLPPAFKPKLERLDETLTAFKKNSNGVRWQIAVELRQADWYGDELNQVLDRHRAGLVLHDMPGSANFALNEKAPFLYMRFHGPRGDYGGEYGRRGLRRAANILNAYKKSDKPIYAFFNNDRDGYAIEDARALRTMLE